MRRFSYCIGIIVLLFSVGLSPVNSARAFGLKDLVKPIDGLYKAQKKVIRDAQKAVERAATEADTKREARGIYGTPLKI